MPQRVQGSRSSPLRIGMIGGGTVGGGVYEILMGNSGNGGHQLPHLRRPCVISKICVKDLSKPRSFHLDSEVSSLVTDVNSILNDDSIELIIEVMGGTELAKTVVLEALKRGKAVITANKSLIAEHMSEIEKTLATNPKSQFAYEAAVCGGIPIVQVLQSCYAGDVIHQVMGVCNGTINYMLGKMEQGMPYEQALTEARDLGFLLEGDTTNLVEGYDVRAKIAILAKLAFGVTVSPVKSIPCRGITELSSIDFEYAKLLHCTIKLLGTAGRMSRFAQYDGALSVYVSPVMIPNDHLLASTRGNNNCVAVNSGNIGLCTYSGPGEGRFPAANSVVADIVRVANSSMTSRPAASGAFPLQSTISLDFDFTRAWYIRIPFMDSIGIIRTVGELAEDNDVSIHSILQNPILDRMEADFCLTTEECKMSQVKALCDDLEQQDFVRGPPLFLPLLWEHP
ncbi:Homoserine dehydrogenase [Seminavis robusta]|uniref:Homoserine dehydrogenase n=1 Tax=Seminavis robusta TaxID=568900 RepID=A0A9N8DWY9_9STRA|nr:Homoserine dehydrogenase [Seminavis robusta]|eukprot:Sro335_g120070.1 Homoserine dehydrogenase (453) ;mRNA; r:35923-37281